MGRIVVVAVLVGHLEADPWLTKMT
jgi:hypothetical protein